MPLDAKIRKILDGVAGMPPLSSLDPPAARRRMVALSAMKKRIPAPGVEATDLLIAANTIAARLYRPAQKPVGIVVFFHGSGFVVFDLDTHDELCSHLCLKSGCAVLSVDYRLAPENKFPAAMEDCHAAVRWLRAGNVRGSADLPLFLAGDSAGGNLAAVVAIAMREAGEAAAAGQVLIYPVTDHYSVTRASYAENGTGFGLTSADMRWFWDHYLGDSSQASDWRASPIRHDSLAGLPPAFVVTAGYDVLRDEGRDYAERLRESGVNVTHIAYPTMNHGFIRAIGVVEEAYAALEEATEWIRRRCPMSPSAA